MQAVRPLRRDKGAPGGADIMDLFGTKPISTLRVPLAQGTYACSSDGPANVRFQWSAEEPSPQGRYVYKADVMTFPDAESAVTGGCEVQVERIDQDDQSLVVWGSYRIDAVRDFTDDRGRSVEPPPEDGASSAPPATRTFRGAFKVGYY